VRAFVRTAFPLNREVILNGSSRRWGRLNFLDRMCMVKSLSNDPNFFVSIPAKETVFTMSERNVIANQKAIIKNQKTIISNQVALRSNQNTIKRNQSSILKNQASILKNQTALDTIVANQKEILARLSK
jgi:hypothetical protein